MQYHLAHVLKRKKYLIVAISSREHQLADRINVIISWPHSDAALARSSGHVRHHR